MNKKASHKIVWKIDIKNVKGFLINKLIINKNNFKNLLTFL